MLNTQTLVLIFVVALVAGCGDKREADVKVAKSQPVVPKQTDEESAERATTTTSRISKERALELAKAVAADKKISLDLFEEPTIRYDQASKSWLVSYTMKPPVKPEGHFMVMVNEEGETTFVAGS